MASCSPHHMQRYHLMRGSRHLWACSLLAPIDNPVTAGEGLASLHALACFPNFFTAVCVLSMSCVVLCLAGGGQSSPLASASPSRSKPSSSSASMSTTTLITIAGAVGGGIVLVAVVAAVVFTCDRTKHDRGSDGVQKSKKLHVVYVAHGSHNLLPRRCAVCSCICGVRACWAPCSLLCGCVS